LRTDLGALADLIEIAFASNMDSSGRAAVQEMRVLSRMGLGLNVLAGLNELAHGMGQGYVWIADGKLVGNVSAYLARDLPQTWVIVNVAVYPAYQRRGIASHLMAATLDMIRAHGGKTVVLQVDADNVGAQRVYQRLGFMDERVWIAWRRNAYSIRPVPLDVQPPIHIAHRRSYEWRAEYALAEQVRPAARGGLGWLRPLHRRLFNRSLWKQITDFFSLQSLERLVIRSDDEEQVLASLWIETGLTSSSTQLTLLVHPDYEGLYDDALLNTAVRRFGGGGPLTIEHPADCETTSAILRRYHFTIRREVVHMRWDVR
jgi:ribosomal protein S18 acetylase RimI-like enzyme